MTNLGTFYVELFFELLRRGPNPEIGKCSRLFELQQEVKRRISPSAMPKKSLRRNVVTYPKPFRGSYANCVDKVRVKIRTKLFETSKHL